MDDGDVDYNWKNSGSSERKGFEAGLETTPWHNLSLATNGIYTLATPEDDQADSSSCQSRQIMCSYSEHLICPCQLKFNT